MNLLARVSAVTLLLTLLSCEKASDLLSITRSFEGDPVTHTVPATPIVVDAPIPFPVTTVETNTRDRLAEYGMTEGNLRSARLKAITLTVDDPGGNVTLADIKDVTVVAETANQPAVTIATYAGAGSPINSDQLTVVDLNLREYVLDDPIEISGSFRLARATANPITVRIDFVYEVTGGI